MNYCSAEEKVFTISGLRLHILSFAIKHPDEKTHLTCKQSCINKKKKINKQCKSDIFCCCCQTMCFFLICFDLIRYCIT